MNILTWTTVRDELLTPPIVNSPGPVASYTGRTEQEVGRVSE